MGVQIITDSASDITREKAADWEVTVLPLKTVFGDEVFLDGVTMQHEEFYQKLVETDQLPTTSQLPPFEYQEAFQKVREVGDTAVCISLSAKLSGSCQSARIAAGDFPEIEVVNSENVCVGQQILVRRAVELREQGLDAHAIATTLNREKKRIRLIALLDTLEYLKKGGRVSAATAFAGGLLSIKPVVGVQDGEVVLFGKARGSKNGSNLLNRLVEKEGGIDFSMPFCIGYTGLSDALLQKYIADSANLYQEWTVDLPVSTVGSTIGTHAGPGAIAAAFFIREG